MKRVIGVSLALTLGVLMLGTAPARAATTWVVDDNDGQGAPGNCNAATPAFTTIQAGVNAAVAGDTVQVCRGLYTENVTVNTANLNITGAKAGVNGTRVIVSANESRVTSAVPNLPIFTLGANGITLNGFLIDGNLMTSNNSGIETRPDSSGYRILNNIVRQNMIGINLHGSGAATTLLRRNLIQSNNAQLGVGSAAGNGIYSDQGALGVTIQANHFENNRNAGILLANAGRQTDSIIIQNNRSLNDRTFVAFFGTQNVQVVANRTNDTDDSNDDGSTIFVGGDSSGILIQRNVLVNPEFAGIAVRDTLGAVGGTSNVDVVGNTITGAEGSGIDVNADRFAVVSVRNNSVRNNGVGTFPPRNGIFFAGNTKGNQIRGNRASGNAPLDCRDESTGAGTAGTANTWVNNNGVTDFPNGICP